MKKLLVALPLIAIAVPALGQQTVHVRGYEKANGTYVAPSVRTAPNETKVDNWSSRPNVNPYTGKQGTIDPYAPPKPRTTSNPY